MSNKSEIIRDFNNLFETLVEDTSKIAPTSTIGANKKEILDAIKIKPTLVIDIFCLKVLKYKNQIEDDNEYEKFFMGKNYNDDVSDVTHINIMDHIFELKNIWSTLNNTNKEVIRTYMKFLCGLAQDYFLLS